jgi:hypothetical protein
MMLFDGEVGCYKELLFFYVVKLHKKGGQGVQGWWASTMANLLLTLSYLLSLGLDK